MAACQNKVSFLPWHPFWVAIGALDIKSTYAAQKCYVGTLIGFERQPMTTSLNISVFENRHALIMPEHVKIFWLSLKTQPLAHIICFYVI